MNENLDNYKDLIKMMEAMPKAPAPDYITPKIMEKLSKEDKPGFSWLLKKTIERTAEISWGRFSRDCTEEQKSSFYFFLAGFFFFFIGAILFNSSFYMVNTVNAMVSILLQATLILLAAISLATPGLMLAANMKSAAFWAKRAIMVYGVLILITALLIHATMKTLSGGLIAIAFMIMGIMTCLILMKVIAGLTNAKSNALTGRMDNALL